MPLEHEVPKALNNGIMIAYCADGSLSIRSHIGYALALAWICFILQLEERNDTGDCWKPLPEIDELVSV